MSDSSMGVLTTQTLHMKRLNSGCGWGKYNPLIPRGPCGDQEAEGWRQNLVH